MIILKILLYILLAVLALVLVVLITPAGGEFSFIDGKFRYKVKLWIIDLMDSEGGGLYGWWKKRKANKKDKPKKPKKEKKPKPVKEKKSKKKKKQREKYEWEKELDDIPVNDPEADVPSSVSEDTVSEAKTDAADSSSGAAVHTEEASDEDDKKKKKDSSDDDPFESDDDDNENDEEKKSLSDKIEFLVGVWESAQRPMLKIFKGFKLSDFYIDFVIADEDAYKCALKYGRYSTLIFNGIAFFSQLFTVRLKTIDVRPQFGVSKGRWDTSGKLSFRLGTAVIAGAWFLLTYIFRTFLPEKLRKRKMKKSAARQK
ncbi:hypothetical protein [Ruminococcus sp.]|uniref:hypothetical protein n=1 Tax=Ruminococcus sp. TaxID=41978 RepID=UPI0025EED7F5|nr:hypothetical protein [Ruminococcus sp.]MCR4639133.1 hypothetical protein [Ruminococcus sp.]